MDDVDCQGHDGFVLRARYLGFYLRYLRKHVPSRTSLNRGKPWQVPSSECLKASGAQPCPSSLARDDVQHFIQALYVELLLPFLLLYCPYRIEILPQYKITTPRPITQQLNMDLSNICKSPVSLRCDLGAQTLCATTSLLRIK